MDNNDNITLDKLYKKDSFLESLVNLQDEYTKLHSLNVSKYALLLGQDLHLDSSTLYLIKTVGLLHDIGKICIPNSILNKKESLTLEEYELIKKHSEIGEILLPKNGYEEIKKIIRSHHERFDGKGYPDGLKGEDIPFLARLLSVVDVFDAMTTTRVYNHPKTMEEALKELYKSSRKEINHCGEIIQQLDPNLVDVFIQNMENYNLDFFVQKNPDKTYKKIK